MFHARAAVPHNHGATAGFCDATDELLLVPSFGWLLPERPAHSDNESADGDDLTRRRTWRRRRYCYTNKVFGQK